MLQDFFVKNDYIPETLFSVLITAMRRRYHDDYAIKKGLCAHVLFQE